MCDKEIVVCAAIWVQDHKNKPHGPVNIPSGTVFCGLRHCSIISQLAAYGIAHKNRSVQGFLTSKNRFLTREEASELVKNNNQEMVVDRDVFRDRKLDLIIEKGDVLNFNKRTGKLKIYVMISNGNWHTNFVKSMISFSLKH